MGKEQTVGVATLDFHLEAAAEGKGGIMVRAGAAGA